MTTLGTVLADAGHGDRRLTVYGRGGPTSVEDQFGARGVRVERRELPPAGPEPFLVIEDGGEFVGAIGLAALEGLLEPPVVRPGERDGVSEGYRVLFELLDGTVCTAMDRRQLLAVSREIEDRASRVGTGRLDASFQTVATFESQAEIYRHLADETDLEIHVHRPTDRPQPEEGALSGVTLHATDLERDRYWALAFDSPDVSCGLLAREEDGGYRGFWTDDPDTVERIAAALRDR
jgi:hypothetical protein